MATVALFRMIAPELDRGRVQQAADMLGLHGDVVESDDAVAVHDDARVLTQAGSCAKLAGVLLYINHRAALGAIHDKPFEAERAGRWLAAFLERYGLGPGRITDERAKLEVEPWSRYTDAVVFDGRERRRVRARTDVGVRLRLNGLPVSGPRTRIRAAFGADELPLLVHVAVWARLDVHAEAEFVREHDVVVELERAVRGRTECGMAVRVADVRLAYAASEEFHGRPDLLAPYYFVELESPHRAGGRPAAEGALLPRQLLKLPAWR